MDNQKKHSHGKAGVHSHSGFLGIQAELYFAIASGVFLACGYVFSFVGGYNFWISLTMYVVAYSFGGFFTAKEAVENIFHGKFEIDSLMLVAAIGAAILGKWAEGALLLFLFSLGHALEHFAMDKARKSIEALANLAPSVALRLIDGEEQEVSIEDLNLNDIILIKPNTKIPADGVVVKGEGSVNQAPITGESVPVDKRPVNDLNKDYSVDKNLNTENRVFAGTINGFSVLEVKVIRKASDSTIARVIKMVNEAEQQKSPTQLFTDRFEKFFVPSVLILVVLLCLAFLVIDEPFSASFYRAMSVLVAASPCALAISTPSAVLSGIARAARAGVLIKGGKPLEDLGTLKAVAFDKTGTLTEGKPKLAHVLALNGFDENRFLEITLAVERQSDHPLAKAIVRGVSESYPNLSVLEISKVKGIVGKGVSAVFAGKEIFIGNKALFDDNLPKDLGDKVATLEKQGNTTMIVKYDGNFIGLLSLMDVAREESRAVLEKLKSLGIAQMIMLTGDNQNVGEAVAKQIGITKVMGNLMPEDKVAAVEKLNREYSKVAMVGDGVNDAPAMAKSTVGIAMGAAGSDVALETADIALMGDKLESLPFAIGLSRKAQKIIKQNLYISLGMVVLLIPLTITGIASIGPAVMAHEGSTIVVVFNALRLLVYKLDQ